MIYPTRQISVSIRRSPADVYAFAGNPENLPQWAEGLSRTKLERSGDQWIADSPMGKIKVKFAPANQLGVMDHDVTLPSGEVNHNPFRVVPNGEGSEVTFIIFHLPKASDEEFTKDAELVAADLQRLKVVLEK